jgi:hypothetical protein
MGNPPINQLDAFPAKFDEAGGPIALSQLGLELW